MPVAEEARAAKASMAREGEIANFVHDPSPRVIRALLENPSLSEDDILVIAGRKNLPGEILDAIFKDKRWSESYPVRLALAKNPKTPLFSALSIARFLRLFDLAEITRSHVLPVIYRKKLESIVIEKIPTLALGVKKTLAKISAGEILLALIRDGYPEVVKLCLDNPHLVEAHLYKIIGRRTTTPGTIRTIADHRTWTYRYHVKFALVRNEHTPLARSVLFLPGLKTGDLKDLFRDPSLPGSIRPYIHRELIERGEDPSDIGAEEERVFEIGEEELEEFDEELKSYEIDADIRREPGSRPEDDPSNDAEE